MPLDFSLRDHVFRASGPSVGVFARKSLSHLLASRSLTYFAFTGMTVSAVKVLITVWTPTHALPPQGGGIIRGRQKNPVRCGAGRYIIYEVLRHTSRETTNSWIDESSICTEFTITVARIPLAHIFRLCEIDGQQGENLNPQSVCPRLSSLGRQGVEASNKKPGPTGDRVNVSNVKEPLLLYGLLPHLCGLQHCGPV